MAATDSRMVRGLLTEAQWDILVGDREVKKKRKQDVRAEVRRQIRQSVEDLNHLEEEEPKLYKYALDEICGDSDHLARRVLKLEEAIGELDDEGLIDLSNAEE